MDINDLTLGQLKELNALFNKQSVQMPTERLGSINCMIGKQVIIRTYSAGVWFGMLVEKSGNEVILKDARRMYQWWAAESISLSAVSIYGIKQDKSKIVEAVPSVWLEAIEIIPCAELAIKSLVGAPNVKAQ